MNRDTVKLGFLLSTNWKGILKKILFLDAFPTLLLFLLLFSNIAKSQPATIAGKEIVFDQPPFQLGLTQRAINCMIQDKEGFLWIGTYEGLIKYDGYSTIIYQTDNSSINNLHSNKIISLLEDKDGILWIGTHMGGLFSYDKNINKFIHYLHDPDNPESISNDCIWSIVQDKNGYLWLGTEDGLNKFNPSTKKFTRNYSSIENKNSISDNFITHLHIDHENNLWAGTENGVNLIKDLNSDELVVERFMYSHDLSNNELHNYIYQLGSIFRENETIVYWTTKKGLKRLQNGDIKNYELEDKPSSFSFFRTLFVLDNEDRPYVLAGSEMGFNIFDTKEEQFIGFYGNYEESTNLSHNTVLSIFIDNSGVLWVGTKKGINKYSTYSKNFELHLTKTFDDTKSIITGIQGSADGGYWISTIGGGLYKFYRGEAHGKNKNLDFQKYKFKGAEGNDFVDFIQTIYSDKKGNVWIGTAGAGVYHFNENKMENRNGYITSYTNYNRANQKLNHDFIMSITGGNDNSIWIGTWSGGLTKIHNNGKISNFDSKELSEVPLVVLYEDKEGVLWIGTRGKGVYKTTFTNNVPNIVQFKSEHGNSSLSNNFISTIFEDHAGGFWIGSEGGLDLFDRRNETFVNVPIEGHFNNQVVVGILEDEKGNLWLSHWKGLTEINPSDKSYVNNYDVSDRIQGGFFYNNICYKDDQGNLFFGGANGFNIINPLKIEHNPIKPVVTIKNFNVFNKPINVNEEYNGRIVLNKSLDLKPQIRLRYYENSISFEFASLHFAAPEKNQYKYMLVGFEQEWQETDATRRYVSYTNLPPGEYVFKVIASNNDGIWSDEEEKVLLSISPPWWKTNYAILGYSIVILMILFFFRQLVIIRTNFVNEIKLERINRETIEKLNMAKLQFFTNISHEFRTPLTLILGPLDKILSSNEGSRFLKEQLGTINLNAQRLLRLINQLMDFRKIEAGNIKLEIAEGNIVKFIKEIKLSFDGLAEEMKVDFVFTATTNIIKLWYDRDQFEKILFNLLSNSFKNVKKNGKISISIYEKPDHVSIVVEDNGRGIKKELLNKIFERFYSTDDHFMPSTGIGLALAKSLVEIHHGSIEVQSVENEYTKFIINIPLGFEHFDQSVVVHDFKDSEYEGHYKLGQDIQEEALLIDRPQENQKSIVEWKKILIVEDNYEVMSFIKSIFVDKYIILVARDGREGLDLAIEEMPDVIISDVMMPIMDGINLCKQIKTNIKTSHIPVILLTARTSLIYTVEGLEKGADDYITKPFSPKVLELKVRNIIKAREQLRKVFDDKEVLSIEPKKVTLTSMDEKFIHNALESIEKNMSSSEYSINDLGRDVGFSRMQLYRKLKAITGMSTNEFIRNIRLKRAAQLIEQNQLTIAEVTYEVGFTDLQYFRSCFKKQFGINPSDYGKKSIINEEEEEEA